MLRCPAGEQACSGAYRLKAGRRALGTVRFTVAAGRSSTRVLRLDRRARAALRAARGRVKVSQAARRSAPTAPSIIVAATMP